MENILILSDIHAYYRYAVEAVKMHPECRTVLFLGDGCRHLDALREVAPQAAFVAVRGNCDTFLDGVSETELTLEISGHRIFLCHGHTRGVKYGLGGLLSAAKERKADIALYGHTHIAHEEYDSESGIYLLCPGSIGAPRDGKFTYGLLSLDAKNVLFSVGEIR
ncbi:MAG: YfcE family phosphodiesterase [Clostridia bacterium]|nr:YfcE family phosphodiesterase [Clostridia bacterium]